MCMCSSLQSLADPQIAQTDQNFSPEPSHCLDMTHSGKFFSTDKEDLPLRVMLEAQSASTQPLEWLSPRLTNKDVLYLVSANERKNNQGTVSKGQQLLREGL